MFVVSVKYIVPLEEVDRHLSAHVEFLNKNYEKGIFLVSGRKVPRTGGVIIARVGSRQELERVLSEDPFNIAGVAEYDITEFVASLTAKELTSMKEA